MLETNLDDLLPELVPDAIERCFAAGALDVWTVPVLMKKGRPGIVLSVLARPSDEPALARVLLEETSALGVRVTRLDRYELDRELQTVEVDGGAVRVQDRPSRRTRRRTSPPSTTTVPRWRARNRALRQGGVGGGARQGGERGGPVSEAQRRRREPDRAARAAHRLARERDRRRSPEESTRRSSPVWRREHSARGRSR